MLNLLRSVLQVAPPIHRRFEELLSHRQKFKPGHYYSTIPDMDAVKRDADRIYCTDLRTLGGIDLNIDGQLKNLEAFGVFYNEQPFSEQAAGSLRYYFENSFFSYADALFLYCMMRHVRPRRIIEIGSGFSSFVMLDTNERFFGGEIKLTFIEPYPERLKSRLKPEDARSARIIESFVQQADLSLFGELEANDILFIDSTHVSKVGSDVNHIFFNILPTLRPGVFVHVHDVFYPFEYPLDWAEAGRFWNEDYLLRAFLMFNSAFGIYAWDQFLARHFPDKMKETMPLCLKNPGGSIWLKRNA